MVARCHMSALTTAAAANKLPVMSETARTPLITAVCVVLVLANLLVYLQVRNFDFVSYDDGVYVYENAHVQKGLAADSILWAFTTGQGGNWHPLTWLSLMLDCTIFGTKPGWMHLTSLLLHIANTLLLFAVLKSATSRLWPSAFVAAAFALHPMHVESVAWVAERKDVLSTLFLLLTLAAYVGYARRGGRWRYLLTLVLFAAGLMAKPMLVTLPLLLLLVDHWPLDRLAAPAAKPSGKKTATISPSKTWRSLIIEKVPFLVLAAIFSIVTFLVQQGSGAVPDIDLVPLHIRLANALLSYGRYIGLLFCPAGLAPFYPLGSANINAWLLMLSVLAIGAVSLLAFRYRQTHRYLLTGWLWFVISLIPVIGLIQVGAQSMADRYTYIPYIGLFLVVAWGLPDLLAAWPARKVILAALAVISLSVSGMLAFRQVSYWRDSLTLFTRAINVTRNNAIMLYNRGVVLVKAGRMLEAIEDFKSSIRIRPDQADSYCNLGIAQSLLGRWQDAMEAYKQATVVKPGYAIAYYNLGTAYGNLDRWQEAAQAYARAAQFDPGYADAYYNLGCAYGALSKWPDAIIAYNAALKLKPEYIGAYNNLGIAYENLGRTQEAVQAYRQAAMLAPDNAQLQYALANNLVLQGSYDEAIERYRIAMRLKPGWPDCMNSLAFVIAATNGTVRRDPQEAIRLATTACASANYQNPLYLGTLAVAYASAGRFNEAVDAANKAVSLADAANDLQTRAIIEHHLSYYRQGKPYVVTDSVQPPDAGRP